MIYMFKLWPSAILPPLMCGLLWGKISPYAGAPAVIAGGLSFFLWSDKVLGEPFGIPANFIGHRHELPRTVLRPPEDEGPQARRPLPPRPQLTAGGVTMWLQLTKYLFYLSFFLNIVCGVWVFFGIIQWLRDLNKQ